MIFSKKSLGQNFLHDPNIIRKIVNLVNIKNRNVIEIGPGKGSLTEEILNRKPSNLFVIEKDNDLARHLKQKYKNNRLIKIYNEDVLKTNFDKIDTKRPVIFGNLPYNISSQILIKVIKLKKWPPKFSDIVFMFQKELGEKIIGKFFSSNYGRLSIITNYRLEVYKKFLVSPNCFIPKPKVDSMIIHFKPKLKKIFEIKDLENLERVTNILFSNKRKMINKNIKKILKNEKIKKIKNINLKSRPSELRPEIFYKITELFEENN